MIPDSCLEVHTSPLDRPSVPAWFAEVVIVARHLAKQEVLDPFAQQVRLRRGRFGRYEPIDFLALLLGYAISGERTLADFFERVAPFGTAFMALFGRASLPHRSSLSRFLADVDRPCLEAFRQLFEQSSFAAGWTHESIGGIWDRQGRRYIVFNVDATRQAARQRALPTDPALPPARRRLDAVCAPGYKGRKRGEVVRTRTVALQMHTRQWLGTYAGRGNGDYRAELASALQAITAYLAHFALTPQVALVRLDGQYGDAAVIAQLMQAGVFLITRGRGYRILEHPQLQRVLAHPPTTSVTSRSTGEVIELFEGGWLPLDEGLPAARVIVTRHRAATSGRPVTVGKRIGDWVYELFITTLEADHFLVEDVLDLYHGRGAFEAVLADEDVEEDPDRWCSYTECGQELWQIACQWVWNVRLCLGQTMQPGSLRELEWAPPTEAAPLCFAWEDPPEEHGPWQCAGESGRAAVHFTAEALPLQEDGTLRCPAGAILWLGEVRQENAFTEAQPSNWPLSDRLSALCSARAVSGPRDEGQSLSSGQRGSSSLAPTGDCRAQIGQARTNPLGGYGWSSASPQLDDPLAQAICGDPSFGSDPVGGQTSCSSAPCRAFPSPLELAGPARPQCWVRATAPVCDSRWRSR